MLTSERREKKKQGKIRNSEYYGMEPVFDTLYAESRNGKTFNHLMEIIESEENIKLAYRTIKRNHGSKTPGVDKKTIRNLAKLSEDEYVRLVKKKFSNYHPRPVRREEIPKDNGKTRPLGIPAISDRIVQQCILQVMEPICEANFSENSNGFRPNRSAETAIAQCCRLIQVQHLYHVVDLDIKGFFDNINHTKLIRQIWSLGIRDKKLLCIIKQMLKAPVILPNGEKIYPCKGTPQGGILSPLLANIVLNELDWWIASQWENMPTRTEFTTRQNRAGTEIKSHVYRALRRSNLKEMHAVRYADDFKIFCSSHADAVKAYHATAKWLKDRLRLDISPEKSRIVNLKRQYSEFLGFKLKVRKRSDKYVVHSHLCDKAYKKVQKKLTEEVKKLEHTADDKAQFMQLMTYNAVVAGIHQYYCIATAVSEDFGKLAYGVKKQLHNRLRNDLTRKGELKKGYIKEKYGKSSQLRFLHGRPVVPIGYVQSRNAQHKRKSVNKYTPEGRELIHKNLNIDTKTMLWLMRNPVQGRSIEYADNRISLYAAQHGKCAVTGEIMEAHEIHCHHKKPVAKGGTDEYQNLVLVSIPVHKLIHASDKATIRFCLNLLNLDSTQISKLNKFREMAEMPLID